VAEGAEFLENQNEVAAVPAPRFLVVRHDARFPRDAGSWARKWRCSLLGMTTLVLE